MRRMVYLVGLCSTLTMVARAATDRLMLNADRHSPFDLEITGLLKDETEAVYVSQADLAVLPSTEVALTGEFGSGDTPLALTVVWLADLWAALPVQSSADTLLARCKDGYFSVYQQGQFAELKPFLVVKINGQGPEKWPPAGVRYNPGPHVILVSSKVAPAVADLLDAGHKKPWGVTSIEVARFADSFQPAFTGKWTKLSAAGELGRDIWINSCASCHVGPEQMSGGTKSARPFEVVAAHARYNRDYFERYVRDPQSTMPGAKMEAHPHYNDEQMAALVAFITADGAP